jgi:membrane-associated phospholipid phosphatase
MATRARRALIGAAAGAVLLVLTWFLAFHVGLFRHADRSTFEGFNGFHHHVYSVANFIAHLCDPKPYVFFAVIPVAVALLRRRPRLALAIGAILLGANVSAQLIKPLLAMPRPVFVATGATPSAASWPSGHATAAMAFALTCVLAAPPRFRPFVAALGAAFAIAVSYSFLALGWHYPSDVFGGFLLAATWTLLGVAALYASEARAPRPATASRRPPLREMLGPPATALLGALVLVAVVAIARPHPVVSYARAHEAFMVGAAAIGVLALVLATGLMLTLRR